MNTYASTESAMLVIPDRSLYLRESLPHITGVPTAGLISATAGTETPTANCSVHPLLISLSNEHTHYHSE